MFEGDDRIFRSFHEGSNGQDASLVSTDVQAPLTSAYSIGDLVFLNLSEDYEELV